MFVPTTYSYADIDVEEQCWPFDDAMLNVFVLDYHYAFKCLNTHGDACCTFVAW